MELGIVFTKVVLKFSGVVFSCLPTLCMEQITDGEAISFLVFKFFAVTL